MWIFVPPFPSHIHTCAFDILLRFYWISQLSLAQKFNSSYRERADKIFRERSICLLNRFMDLSSPWTSSPRLVFLLSLEHFMSSARTGHCCHLLYLIVIKKVWPSPSNHEFHTVFDNLFRHGSASAIFSFNWYGKILLDAFSCTHLRQFT